MTYHFSKTVDGTFDQVIEDVTAKLQEIGFGILCTIPVSEKLKGALDVDIPRYTILGACNPSFAYKALQSENKIGVMLPCNFVIQQKEEGKIEVSAVDPIASMAAIDNPDLGAIAGEVRELIKSVIDGL
jgi:uncharacterized protein (DUF302 family)